MKQISNRRESLWSALAMVALLIWTWNRLDFFHVTKLVAAPDGTLVRWPNALASVDHPFHAARFGMFLDALGHGHLPHWVFSHQGGYPAEFYPFGSSLIDLTIWALTLGQMSIPMVHTWAVAVVLALPAAGFWMLARLANLPAWIAPVGLAIHLCVRGWWWSGGSYELIEWGLITNVLAAMLVFLALFAVAATLCGGGTRWVVAGALLIAWSELTNPRSLLAVVALAAAATVVWWTGSRPRAIRLQWLAAPFALGAALSMPILLPLVVDNDLYYFVHYSGYNDIGAWLDSSIQAVSGPGFVLTLAGLAITLGTATSVVERLIAWTTILYGAGTAWIVLVDWPQRFTGQLETTRLMPFQRLLMISLVAITIGRALLWLRDSWSTPLLVGTAVLIPVLYVIAPPGFVPVSDRGLVRDGTMARAGIVDLRAAVEQADVAAAPDSAILILGTTAYWHDHLWATLWTDRLLFYDDWLWYWQREHVGAYDPDTEHAYTSDGSTIDTDYLATHGIGAIVVTGQAKPAAGDAKFLEQVRSGIYDVYLVTSPTTLATLDGLNLTSAIDDETISVTGVEAGGTVTVRENWFPRWHATVDGHNRAIVHRSDGYMDITVPAGSTRLEISYGRAGFDWLADAIALIAALVCLALVVGLRPIARWGPRSASADSAPGPG